jgi:hypothetical protein
VLAGWLIFVLLGVCVAALFVIVSALVKLIASVIWPAYVTSGWLRFFGGGARRRDHSCCLALSNGLKAGYQVLWASDVLTNALILGKERLFPKAIEQLIEVAKGQRDELDAECRRLSCLPPVVVGLFQSSWDLAARAIAEKLGIAKDDVEEAWRSLARQMILIGREAIEVGLVTKDWVTEIPAELIIGLPARALLDTLERSPRDGEIILASGIVLKHGDRPQGKLFDKVWEYLMEARNARAAVRLSSAERDLLCASLLAGGGALDDLPTGLAAKARDFETLPAARKEACLAIQRPLIAMSVECSRQQAFKDKLGVTIECIASEDSYVSTVLLGVSRNKDSDSDSDSDDDGNRQVLIGSDLES